MRLVVILITKLSYVPCVRRSHNYHWLSWGLGAIGFISRERTFLGNSENPMYLYRASQVALVVKNLPANAGDLRDNGSIPGLGRSPGGQMGNGNPLQYSCLENSMDRGAWQATVRRVTESDTTGAIYHSSIYVHNFVPPPKFI